MNSITSVNAVIMLVIPSLFPIPQQLQGFSADDIFDTEPLVPAETSMGLDGTLSAGFVPTPIKQGIILQSDSASNAIFEAWWAAQQAVKEVYFATGVVSLSAIGRTYALTDGVLTAFPPMPDAKRVLAPRKYGITWGKIIPAPI